MGKKLAIALLAMVLAGLGVHFGRPLYRTLKTERLLHAAERKEAAHDVPEAGRFYALALAQGDSNLKVLGSSAAFLARTHDRGVVRVRARICQLKPQDEDALFEYAESALIFGEPATALAALTERAKQPGSKIGEQARFFHLLGTCFYLKNNPRLADGAYAEAVRRDPKNRLYLINFSQLRLCSPDAAIREAAITALDSAGHDPAELPMALPALLKYAAQASTEPAKLEGWLQMANDGLSPVDDSFLTYLSALKRWRPDRLGPALPAFTKAAAGRPGGALPAQLWLTLHGLDKEALAFRDTLSAKDQSARESLLLAAKAMSRLKQIDRLRAFLEDASWKPVEAVRLAWKEWLRRTHPEQGPESDNAGEDMAIWKGILGKANGGPVELLELARLAEEWGWAKENEETLWTSAGERNASAIMALSILSRTYLKKGDGAGYLRVLKRESEITPASPAASNNLAYMCFLLRRDPERTASLSDDLCRRYPQSVEFMATNAFGHFLNGDFDGGMKLFQKTRPESLAGTAQGMTYGLLLAANGNPDAARFLKEAERWTHFPEERQLIAEARSKVKE